MRDLSAVLSIVAVRCNDAQPRASSGYLAAPLRPEAVLTRLLQSRASEKLKGERTHFCFQAPGGGGSKLMPAESAAAPSGGLKTFLLHDPGPPLRSGPGLHALTPLRGLPWADGCHSR